MSTRQNYFFFRPAKSPRPAIPMEGRAPWRKDWKPENWVARTPGRAWNCCCATCHSMVIQPRDARLRTPRQKSPRKRANSRAKACRAKPIRKATKKPSPPLRNAGDHSFRRSSSRPGEEGGEEGDGACNHCGQAACSEILRGAEIRALLLD